MLQLLLVDDDPMLRMITRVALSQGGVFTVVEAGSGPEALELTERQGFDVIVIDVMMPGMDGPTVLEHLQARSTPPPPVVFLTAKASAADRARLEALGAHGVLSKPYDPNTLVADLLRVSGLP